MGDTEWTMLRAGLVDNIKALGGSIDKYWVTSQDGHGDHYFILRTPHGGNYVTKDWERFLCQGREYGFKDVWDHVSIMADCLLGEPA